jgi:hypothetical protein
VGIAVDGSSNVYVTDFTTVQQISSAGIVTPLAGAAHIKGCDDGVGNVARFHSATGVTVDNAGNLFVADSGNHTIRKGSCSRH